MILDTLTTNVGYIIKRNENQGGGENFFLPQGSVMPHARVCTTQKMVRLAMADDSYKLAAVPPVLLVMPPWNNGNLMNFDYVVPSLQLDLEGSWFMPAKDATRMDLAGFVRLVTGHFVPYVKCGSCWIRMDSASDEEPEVCTYFIELVSFDR